MSSLLILALIIVAAGFLPQMPWGARDPVFGTGPYAKYYPSILASALGLIVIILVATGRL